MKWILMFLTFGALNLILPISVQAQSSVTDLDCANRGFSYCRLPHAGMNCSGTNGSCQALVDSSSGNDCTVEATISNGNIQSCNVCGESSVNSAVCVAAGGTVIN